MKKIISPARAAAGSVLIPGDKSISHRYAMLSSIADGVSKIHNYSTGADCQSTLGCMRALGIQIDKTGNEVQVHGKGLHGLTEPAETLEIMAFMEAADESKRQGGASVKIKDVMTKATGNAISPSSSQSFVASPLTSGCSARALRSIARSRNADPPALKSKGRI